jgi:hypothetical protein
LYNTIEELKARLYFALDVLTKLGFEVEDFDVVSG